MTVEGRPEQGDDRGAWPFWGRHEALRQLERWLRDPAVGWVHVHGVGGIGKSALIERLSLRMGKGWRWA